jgi:hypothetical protein
MRQTIGIVGALAALTLLVWAIGWLFLGWHAGLFHLLVPLAIVLTIAQVARRVAV